MKLFVHIEIGDWRQGGYEKPWVHYASSLSSDVMGTDLDNESESLVADLVIKLIERSDKVFFLINALDPQLPLGAIFKLFNYSVRNAERISMMVLSGNHEQTELIASELGEKFFKESDETKIKDLIRQFAQ